MSEWYQGTYEVKNTSKYLGTKPPFFRSSWERRFMYWCDHNPNVLKWSSEAIKIPYVISEGGYCKTHNYIPDFYMEVKNTKGEIKKFIVEVKPYDQGPIDQHDGKGVYVPKPPKNKNQKALKRFYFEQKTYKKNALKWNAAKLFCQTHNIEFMIITKKDLLNL